MYDNLRNVLDFDDLLFESRNKEYGAYQLRKKYNSVVIAGIIIATILCALIVILPFLITPKEDNVLTGTRGYTELHLENLEPPKEEIYVPPSPPPRQAIHVEEIVKYVPPVVVDSIIPIENTQLTTDEYINQTTDERTDVIGKGSGENLGSGQEGTESDEPFFLVEVMPSFQGGGIEKFRTWVLKHATYPQAAYEKNIKGTVYLTFVVEKDGTVSNITVVQGIDPLLDDEAVKVISKSPSWNPGLQRGEAVRVRYAIKLNFN